MRGPTAYETYLWRMYDYYKIKKIDQPEWIDKAREYYYQLFDSARSFGKMCSDNAISKSTMKYLEQLGTEPLDDLPQELIEGSADINLVLKEMYIELVSNKEIYFLNEWTLTKKGRRKMREFVDRIPSASGIMPPKNEFTNVPREVSFRNRINADKSEHKLSVSLAGSIICIKNENGNHEEYIDFTERFLDEIIPLMQWENFENLLQKKDCREVREESVYQNYKTVIVEVNWNEYDLTLSPANADNVFVKVLRLVWEEYGEILAEKNMVLPWFCTMGWIDRFNTNRVYNK